MIIPYPCPHCDNPRSEVWKKGGNNVLRCEDCGKFIKNISKTDLYQYGVQSDPPAEVYDSEYLTANQKYELKKRRLQEQPDPLDIINFKLDLIIDHLGIKEK